VCIIHMWLGLSIDIQNKTSYIRLTIPQRISHHSFQIAHLPILRETNFTSLNIAGSELCQWIHKLGLSFFGTYSHRNLSDISNITFSHTYMYQLNSRFQTNCGNISDRFFSTLFGSNPLFWSPRYLFCVLVGGIPTPLKNMKVSWDYYSQYMKK